MKKKTSSLESQKLLKPKKQRIVYDEFDDIDEIYRTHLEVDEPVEVAVKEVDEDHTDTVIDKKEVKRKNKEEKKKFYVEPARLGFLIEEYYGNGVISDELATYLYNIANRISFAPNFVNYSWKEEMIGDGLIKQMLALKNRKFDPKRGNAFSYFTKIVYNAFKNRIKNENKEHNVIKELQKQNYDTLTTQHRRITTDDHNEFD